jgi:predicted RNA-binding Zn-ribbon protein involved in translation (DUF1610 family)
MNGSVEMLFASFDLSYILPSLIIVAFLYGAYRYAESRRPKTYCPKCGGEMTFDAAKYRYTVEWTCNECGETFEQLRNR